MDIFSGTGYRPSTGYHEPDYNAEKEKTIASLEPFLESALQESYVKELLITFFINISGAENENTEKSD